MSKLELERLFFGNDSSSSSSSSSSSNEKKIKEEMKYERKPVPFNKGRLYNMGFDYLMRDLQWEFNCVILHDVDLIPMNLNLDYACDDMPKHFSVSVRKFHEETLGPNYRFLTGGVLAIRPHHFIKTNGFSNEYFSWGGEDDDFTIRMIEKELCVKRFSAAESVYVMQNHKRSSMNEKRWSLIMSATNRIDYDGLSNLNRVARLTQVIEYPKFTHLKVKLIYSRPRGGIIHSPII
jgi:hypothetical protein